MRGPRRTVRRRRVGLLATGAIAVAALVAGATVATAAPASAQFCLPILLPCPLTPAIPTPSPSPSLPGVPGFPALPGGPSLPGLPGGGSPLPSPSPSGSTSPPAVVTDDDSMVFTQPPAQLGARSLSFTGLQGVAPVRVRLANGTRVTVLRLSAESITIHGFALTVRRGTGPTLATTADTMTLRGHVRVYVNSLTGTTADGTAYTLGAETPPPKDGIAPGILRVTLGLVGTSADAIAYTNTDQRLSE